MEKKKNEYRITVLEIILLALFSGSLYVTTRFFVNNEDLWRKSERINDTKFANFGEFVSGLLSIVTVLLIYLTFRQTRKSNDLTRTGVTTSWRIAEDSTFFNLVDSNRKIVLYLHERAQDENIARLKELERYYNNRDLTPVPKSYFEVLYAILDLTYKKIYEGAASRHRLPEFYRAYDWQVGHYFRNIIFLINWVHLNGNLDDGPKEMYMSFLKTYLNADELRLIFYYVISRKDEYRLSLVNVLDRYNFFSSALNFLIISEGDNTDQDYYRHLQAANNFSE